MWRNHLKPATLKVIFEKSKRMKIFLKYSNMATVVFFFLQTGTTEHVQNVYKCFHFILLQFCLFNHVFIVLVFAAQHCKKNIEEGHHTMLDQVII